MNLSHSHYHTQAASYHTVPHTTRHRHQVTQAHIYYKLHQLVSASPFIVSKMHYRMKYLFKTRWGDTIPSVQSFTLNYFSCKIAKASIYLSLLMYLELFLRWRFFKTLDDGWVSLYKIDDGTKADIYLNVFYFNMHICYCFVFWLIFFDWMQKVPK